jgi:hypothetical protein
VGKVTGEVTGHDPIPVRYIGSMTYNSHYRSFSGSHREAFFMKIFPPVLLLFRAPNRLMPSLTLREGERDWKLMGSPALDLLVMHSHANNSKIGTQFDPGTTFGHAKRPVN